MAVVTMYRGARNPAPSVEDLTWDETVEVLEEYANRLTWAAPDAHIEEQKKAMVAFSPHRLKPGATRSNESVDAVTLLVLDIDKTTDTPDDVAARMHAAGLAGLLYESAKSTPEAPRFRIVSPITREIEPSDCYVTRRAYAEMLGFGPGCGIEGAIDESKIFFLGRAHNTPERGVWVVPGAPVDVDALPAPRLAWGSAQAPAAALAPHLAALPPADAGIATALGDWREHDGRKWHVCGAVGGLMRKLSYTRERCEAELRAWLDGAQAEGVDVEAGIRHALGAWAKNPDEVSGETSLAEHLGAEHAGVVARAIHASSAVGRMVARLAPAPRVQLAGGDWSPLGPRLDFGVPSPPLDYFCRPLCLTPSRGKVSLIAGLPGHGKGPFADYLAVSFAFGGGVFACEPKNVLLIDFEGARLTKLRIERLCRALGRAPADLMNTLALHDATGGDVTSDAFYADIERAGADVVIVDSYSSAMLSTGYDSNKPEFACFAQALGSLDKVVICVAHAKKLPEQGVRPTLADVAGSGILGGMAQTGIVMWRPAPSKNDPDPRHLNVACMRAPETPFAPFQIQFDDTPAGDLALVVRDESAPTTADQAQAAEQREVLTVIANRCLAFMRRTDGDVGKPYFLKAFHGQGASDAKVAQALTALARAGFVTQEHDTTGRSKAGLFYVAPHAPERVAFDDSGECREETLRSDGSVAGFSRP